MGVVDPSGEAVDRKPEADLPVTPELSAEVDVLVFSSVLDEDRRDRVGEDVPLPRLVLVGSGMVESITEIQKFVKCMWHKIFIYIYLHRIMRG